MGLGQLIGLTEAAAKPTINVGATSKNAPLLCWEGAGSLVYLEIDCIPSFRDSLGGQVTDFAIEDGGSVADHFIRKAEVITLEINQTNTPIALAANTKVAESMKLSEIELTLPPNQFQATGLLYLTTGAIELAKDAVNAVGGALGLGEAFSGPPPLKIEVLTPTSDSDRINSLREEIAKAREKAAIFHFDWLGGSWPNLMCESVEYSRAAGRMLGVFQITLKKITTVKTAQALTLALPATLSAQVTVPAGIKPGKALKGSERAAVASNPALREAEYRDYLSGLKPGEKPAVDINGTPIGNPSAG